MALFLGPNIHKRENTRDRERQGIEINRVEGTIPLLLVVHGTDDLTDYTTINDFMLLNNIIGLEFYSIVLKAQVIDSV